MTVPNHTERAHARFSASGSAKWLSCPASLKAEADYPNTSNSFSQEGTRAHEVADLCLSGNLPASDFLGQTIEGGIVDQEMVDNVQQYIDYIKGIENQHLDAILLCEQRVDYSHLAPQGFGTLDAAILIPSQKTVHIFDLKYGRGVKVDAENNTQSMCYASGLLNDYGFIFDIETWHIHIVQPRVYNFSEWVINTPYLLQWQENTVKPSVDAALSDNPKYNPSTKACQWCRAKANCPSLHKMMETEVIDAFDDLNEDLTQVDDAAKRRILDHKELFNGLISAIEDEVYTRLSNGEPFDGYKLVKGRASTKWTDDAEQALSAKYGDKFYSKKPIGITEGRKLLDKDELEIYTFKGEGSPKLVKETDKGVAINNISFEMIK